MCSLSRAITWRSALVSGRRSPLVLYTRAVQRRDLSPTWVFRSCKIWNPKKKEEKKCNKARTHVNHRRRRRVYCYTWYLLLFFFLNLDYAQRDRRRRALCVVPVFETLRSLRTMTETRWTDRIIWNNFKKARAYGGGQGRGWGFCKVQDKIIFYFFINSFMER